MTEEQQGELEPVRPIESAVQAYVPDDVDYEPEPYEPPPLRRFSKVRQKPATDEQGKIVREPGRFIINDPAEPEAADRDNLLVAIIRTAHGRVYFEEGKNEPTCKSADAINGSLPAENGRYGRCFECELSRFEAGKRPDCRETWDLLCWDLSDDRPMILTMTWSGFVHWRAFYQRMARVADRYPKRDGKAPYILHLYAVPIGVAFEQKGPWSYYVPKFGDELALPTEQTVKMREIRRTLLGEFDRARAERPIERGDVGAE